MRAKIGQSQYRVPNRENVSCVEIEIYRSTEAIIYLRPELWSLRLNIDYCIMGMK